MATGIISSIIHDGANLTITVTVQGANYSIGLSPEFFDSLTAIDKITFITSFVSAQRSVNRLPENVHQELIGTTLNLPNLPE